MAELPDYVAMRAKLREERGLPPLDAPAPETEQPVHQLGTFADYCADFDFGLSDAAVRLEELYESITIWEVYRRLLPNKPHDPYRSDRDFNVACPHEEGKRSLSMWLNDAKGTFFCGHVWEGGNKMGLYCEIRGLNNRPELFHQLKQMMVWEFRRENPYAVMQP